MDPRTFDDIARSVANNVNRRRLLVMMAALPLAKTVQPVAAQTTCAAGQRLCNGTCVDTCCDNNNCGACGNVCTGGLTCFEGVCDCPSGLCLPNTGQGSAAEPHTGAWPALAFASAAAGLAAVWQRRRGANGQTHQPR
ncbi:MAG: hypothetical protein U0031_16975 [Thermomicrobiales bacterium]